MSSKKIIMPYIFEKVQTKIFYICKPYRYTKFEMSIKDMAWKAFDYEIEKFLNSWKLKIFLLSKKFPFPIEHKQKFIKNFFLPE